jgi:hypothetical protein
MRTALLICASALSFVPPALAQDAPPSPPAEARVSYDAAFYTSFAPRTALDMVRQTPGFTLVEGAERRGFSGATGNVLIDGERPIAKSQTLADILQRIPAAQVVRIELWRGGDAAGDGSGHAVLANIVRTTSAGQGVWSLGAEYAGRAPVPNGWASWTGRIGKTDYGLGANGYSLMRNLPGDRVVLAGDGTLTETRVDRSPRSFYEFALNGEASRPMLGGKLHATGQVDRSRYQDDSSVVRFSPSGARLGDEHNPFTETRRTLEAGIDYERGLGAWNLTLAALTTRTHYTSHITSTSRNAAFVIGSIFTQDIARDSGETIVRATLSGAPLAGHRLEAGIEAALNTLGQRLDLELDLGAGPFGLPVPNSNLRVREHRAEAYLVDSWTLDSRWSLEARLAAEISRLSFTGDTDHATELAYLKPSIQLTRRLGTRNQLRARFYRDVGQLDFTDFVSAASLTDDIIKGGNPDLRPETSWRAELAADLRFGASGALGLTLFHHWISDAVDLVPIGPPGSRFDAPANIGKGTLNGAQVSLRLPLKPLIPGGSLTVDATWRSARVTDPLTGERRIISEFEDHAFKAEFRQDLPRRRGAWGATFTGKPYRTFYRFNEVERRRESPSLDLWVETTAIGKLRTRLTLLSLLGTPERRERTFFAPDRTGPVTAVERSRRNPGRWLLLTVSGSF